MHDERLIIYTFYVVFFRIECLEKYVDTKRDDPHEMSGKIQISQTESPIRDGPSRAETATNRTSDARASVRTRLYS